MICCVPNQDGLSSGKEKSFQATWTDWRHSWPKRFTRVVDPDQLEWQQLIDNFPVCVCVFDWCMVHHFHVMFAALNT